MGQPARQQVKRPLEQAHGEDREDAEDGQPGRQATQIDVAVGAGQLLAQRRRAQVDRERRDDRKDVREPSQLPFDGAEHDLLERRQRHGRRLPRIGDDEAAQEHDDRRREPRPGPRRPISAVPASRLNATASVMKRRLNASDTPMDGMHETISSTWPTVSRKIARRRRRPRVFANVFASPPLRRHKKPQRRPADHHERRRRDHADAAKDQQQRHLPAAREEHLAEVGETDRRAWPHRALHRPLKGGLWVSSFSAGRERRAEGRSV